MRVVKTWFYTSEKTAKLRIIGYHDHPKASFLSEIQMKPLT